MEDNEYQKEVKRILGSATFKLWRLDQGIARGTGPRVTSPGRRAMRAMRAMMKAREVIALSTAHPQGSRTERRAAIKAKRTAQRQASRKRQAVGAAVDVFRVGSAEAVAEIRRLIRTFGATR
jgi:hypothetical protein